MVTILIYLKENVPRTLLQTCTCLEVALFTEESIISSTGTYRDQGDIQYVDDLSQILPGNISSQDQFAVKHCHCQKAEVTSMYTY